jgi:sulfur-oxidizing protein SoxY
MAAAIRQVAGDAAIKPGKIKLNIPPLVENGNAVAISVSVDSPMTATDHVRSIHVFTEKNPQPNVISTKLGPRAGKAEISTRIRLADTQQVVAICELSDGSFWSDKVDVILTLSACLEDPV